MKVLVVDDVGLLLMEYAEYVSECGFEVVTATSGSEAWRILDDRSNGIALVITDVDMKHGNGCELVEALVGTRRRLPILVHSAYWRYSDGERTIPLESWAKTQMVGHGAEITFRLKVGGKETSEAYIKAFLRKHLLFADAQVLAAE